jgi:hypothetical protein
MLKHAQVPVFNQYNFKFTISVSQHLNFNPLRDMLIRANCCDRSNLSTGLASQHFEYCTTSIRLYDFQCYYLQSSFFHSRLGDVQFIFINKSISQIQQFCLVAAYMIDLEFEDRGWVCEGHESVYN